MEDKLKQITKLNRGGHKPDHTYCLMEAVAFVAGEEWSDSPACTDPVLATFGRNLNDSMPDDQRQKLLTYIPKLIGTRSTRSLEIKRGYFFADAAVRIFAPRVLRSANLVTHAEILEALDPVIDQPISIAARVAAWAAAWAAWAAWAAAADAAWDQALTIFDQAIELTEDVK